MALELEDADIPPDDTATSTDPICQVPGCGEPLVYTGRGRRPKFCDTHKRAGTQGVRGGGRTRAGGDVASAMSTLGFIYDAMTAGLTIVSPDAAAQWVRQVPGLQAKNETVLAQDKGLRDAINRLSSGSARGTFIAAHLIAAAGPVVTLRRDLVNRSHERAETEPTPDNVHPMQRPAPPAPNPMGKAAAFQPPPEMTGTGPELPNGAFWG